MEKTESEQKSKSTLPSGAEISGPVDDAAGIFFALIYAMTEIEQGMAIFAQKDDLTVLLHMQRSQRLLDNILQYVARNPRSLLKLQLTDEQKEQIRAVIEGGHNED
jgi:uncharacterized protein with von Willebrand factor type A (vWA) domain